MPLRPFPYSVSKEAQADRYPAESEMETSSRPRHKPTSSISEWSRAQTPVLNTSASFPSLRSASAMSFRPPTQNQGKLSGLASAAKQRARDVWSRRRPNPELDTSLKEFLMDSPTIPGRPPLSSQHERNPSVGQNWRQNVFGEAMLSSIEPPAFIVQRLGGTTPLGAGSGTEKAISPLHHLSPLVYSQPSITLVENVDTRPKVPPKGAKDIPRRCPDTNRTTGRERPNTALKADVPPRASTSLGIMRPREIVIPRKKTSNGIMAGRIARAPVVENPQYPPNRQRADTTPNQTSGSPNPRPRLQIDTNPQTMSPSEGASQCSMIDMEVLRQAAKIQAESYDVLKLGDVRFLQKELTQLESRCQYLKETQKSLRVGRKTLQYRMLTYLRSSRSGVFSHESLLKQEEALTELDEAIEDWDRKVEKAEERRLQVSRKLLEHAAAVLSACSDYILPPKLITTPPRTPERPKKLRAEVESITVYALIADVEQELGRMLS